MASEMKRTLMTIAIGVLFSSVSGWQFAVGSKNENK